MASFRIEQTNPENKVEVLLALLKVAQGQDVRLKPTWVPTLAASFAQAGLENVQSDARDSPPHLVLAMHECSLIAHELFARQFKNEGVAQTVRSLMPEVARETRAGFCWAFTRYTVIGRKPS
jgi:hypothetical protein